jgi:hypothetical protein
MECSVLLVIYVSRVGWVFFENEVANAIRTIFKWNAEQIFQTLIPLIEGIFSLF